MVRDQLMNACIEKLRRVIEQFKRECSTDTADAANPLHTTITLREAWYAKGEKPETEIIPSL